MGDDCGSCKRITAFRAADALRLCGTRKVPREGTWYSALGTERIVRQSGLIFRSETSDCRTNRCALRLENGSGHELQFSILEFREERLNIKFFRPKTWITPGPNAYGQQPSRSPNSSP